MVGTINCLEKRKENCYFDNTVY